MQDLSSEPSKRCHFECDTPLGEGLSMEDMPSRQQPASGDNRAAVEVGEQTSTREPSRDHTIEQLLRLRAEIDQELRQRFMQQICLLLADVVGSTIFYQEHGDVQGRLLIQRHNDTLFPLITSMGGKVIKTIGDAIMAMFEEPRRALQCAVAIQNKLWQANQRVSEREVLRTKISLHYGAALIEAQDVYGELVNVSARLNKLAKPDQILVSQVVYEFLKHDDVLMRPLGSVHWKAGEKYGPIYQVLWLQKAETDRKSNIFRTFQGSYQACFYCGLQEHRTSHCPSRQLMEQSRASARLGYVPLQDLYALFQKERLSAPSLAEAENRQIFEGFYEMHAPYQLRFLPKVWMATTSDWNDLENATLYPGHPLADTPLLKGLRCFQMRQYKQAQAYWQSALRQAPDDYRLQAALGFWDMERLNPLAASQRWHKGLSLAPTPLQQAYIHLLLHRLYEVSGQISLAQQELRSVVALLPDMLEAQYRQALLLVKDSAGVQGLAQLQTLIEQDRRIYLWLLFEPALASQQQVVYFFLSSLVNGARAEATASMMTVLEEINELRQWYPQQEAGLAVIERALARMRFHLQSNSYFGYQDAAYEGNVVLEQLRKLLLQRKTYVQHAFKSELLAVRDQLEAVASTSSGRSLQDIAQHVTLMREKLASLWETPEEPDPRQLWHQWEELRQLKTVVEKLALQSLVGDADAAPPSGLRYFLQRVLGRMWHRP